jgi:predicted aspartyl protease
MGATEHVERSTALFWIRHLTWSHREQMRLRTWALMVAVVSAESCIDFRLIENQVVVAIFLGGEGPFTSLVDVAVAPSVVDLALARELGLRIDETAPGEAAGQGAGRATFYPSELPDLQMGEHRVGSIEAVAADLAALGAKLGRPLHAILGQSFFEGRIVQFDYEHQRLKLDPSTVEEGVSVPIEGAVDLTPVVPVTVNGREVPVVLDTGSSLTLGIYLDAVDDLGLAPARDAATPRTLTGARGEVEALEGMVASLALGDLRLERVPTVFLPRPPGDPTRALGNLGNGFLQHTILTLDYRRRRLNIRAVA